MSALPFREGMGVGNPNYFKLFQIISNNAKFVFTLAKFLIIDYFCLWIWSGCLRPSISAKILENESVSLQISIKEIANFITR